MSEDYPGQAFFHKHNANIKATEERAQPQPVTFEELREDLRCGPWADKFEALEQQVQALRDGCLEGGTIHHQFMAKALTALLGKPRG